MDPSAAYDPLFFEMHLPWRAEYEAISDMLVTRLKFSSVLDMGCGNGFILNRLAQHGKEVTGIDGSSHALAAAPSELRPRLIAADLTQPLRFGRHDLVICSEVAEHLKSGHADILVDNICGHSAGSVFFTGAVPGQGGHGHVNEQSHDYWIAKFAQRGFQLDTVSTTDLRRELSERIHTIWWFTNNALVFRSPTDTTDTGRPVRRRKR